MLDPATTQGDTKNKASGNTVTKEITSVAEWNSECGSSSRRLCAVWFGDKSTSDENLWETQKQTWNNVQQSLISSGNSAVQAYNFVMINARCQSAFIESVFGLGIMNYNIPTVAIMSPAKKRYALFTGSITQEV